MIKIPLNVHVFFIVLLRVSIQEELFEVFNSLYVRLRSSSILMVKFNESVYIILKPQVKII